MRRLAFGLLLATACATTPSSGVSNAELSALLADHWDYTLRTDPVMATRLGDHRFDDRIEDKSFAAREDLKKKRRELLARAKSVAEQKLDPAEATTLALFQSLLESAIATEACEFDEWSLSASNNPLTEWNRLADLHPIKSPADATTYLARVKQAPRDVDAIIDNFRRGASRGAYANAESVKRVLSMVDTQLAQKTGEWAIFAAAKGRPAEFAAALEKELDAGLRPALARYAEFLRKDVLPHGRSDDSPGLSSIPIGAQCYATQIALHTTLAQPPPAESLHALGVAEIARINAEMITLGEKLFGTRELPEILAKLRGDPALYFATDVEVEGKAKGALDAARAKIREYFGILPKADCVVTRIPDYEAPFTTVAYYREPVPDGSKPGQYFINVYQPETRTRYEAEALAFHESIPGHHLQIAIAQELPELPPFRKYTHFTAFIEGWGLYAEQLAEEMKLYSGDLDRMGKLSYEAWRASRLVVDTGLHAMGWSRKQAQDYMLAHTALAPNNIDNEVDRYITWPGQALAYKVGQLEILRLRALAQEKLGARFSIAGFHDAVLGGGAVSLPVLERRVSDWMNSVP